MYHQSYTPFSQTSDDGRWRLSVAFERIEIEQHGEKYPVREPWFTFENIITEKVVWRRQGNWRIDDAHEFFVSDEGWSVIRFHGTSTYSRLLAISPDGSDVLTVGLASAVKPYVKEPPVKEGKWELWIDEHVMHSTAGDFWSGQSRFRFHAWQGRHFFVCRTGWARYLVLDLNEERVVDEREAGLHELFDCIRTDDEKWAVKIIQQTRDRRAELEEGLLLKEEEESSSLPSALRELWDDVFTALLIVRQNRVSAASMLLEELQSFSNPGFGGFISVPLKKGFSATFEETFRKYVHLAMLRIGSSPRGHAIIIFDEVGDWPCSEPHLFRLPECVENREFLIGNLVPGMTPLDVALKIGAPEYIRDTWHDSESCPYRDEMNMECWDYDHLDDEGKPASWALLWRMPKRPLSQEEKSLSASDMVARLLEIETQESDENEPQTELVSITRFTWDEAYWMMREEGIPICVARERLAKKSN